MKLTEEDIQLLLTGIGWYQSEINDTPERLEELKEWLDTKQIISNQELADERREQIRLENDPNIKKYTYTAPELEHLPEWKEKAEKYDKYKWILDFSDDPDMIVMKRKELEQENKQLKEELRKYQVLQYTPKELEIELNKSIILKEIVEKVRYRVKKFRVKDGMIQDKFAYDALREILATKEKITNG